MSLPKASGRIMVDGIPHRLRRGKLIRIPDEWLGQTTHPQSIRKRASKTVGTRTKERERRVKLGEREGLR